MSDASAPAITTNTAASMLANLKAKTQNAPAEQEFQEYKSARTAVKLVTSKGFRITFTNFRYLTQNSDAIAYLDSEIAKGLPGITKGAVLTTSDLDPMTAMRKQARADLMAELEQVAVDEAQGVVKDMGQTVNKAQISPASTKTVVSK